MATLPSEGELVSEIEGRLKSGQNPWRIMALLAIEYGFIQRPAELPEAPSESLACVWLTELTGKGHKSVQRVRGVNDELARKQLNLVASNIDMYLREGTAQLAPA